MRQTDNRGGRWKRLTAAAAAALVLSAVPVLGALFLGPWQPSRARPGGAAPGLSADFLTLDRPGSAAKATKAKGGEPGEVRLNDWEFTRGPSQFN
jgi:hypothetical protein